MPEKKQRDSRDQQVGLAYWMERVLEECDRAGVDFAMDPVHDLRVALRRCRSMSNRMMAMDTHKTWRAMRREGRRLFRRLGLLRDMQVMMEWVRHLNTRDDPAAAFMLNHLGQREKQLKLEAREALQEFDRRRWRSWIGPLHARACRVPRDGIVFQLSALRAWNEAHELHKQAMRNRSAAAFHRLRIGLKRFRYTVENFLPRRHREWGADLKDLQDWLGDVHDLAVLWKTALRIGAFPDAECRAHWRAQIDRERAERIERYRRKMLGSGSLWGMWRAGLLPSDRLRTAAIESFRKWASFLGVDAAHARHVSRLALQLYDGLKAIEHLDREERRNQRVILRAAAITHEAGRATSLKNYNEVSSRLVRRFPAPPGFPPDLLLHTALVVRYHRGKLRLPEDRDFAGLPEAQRRAVLELAGILRLAKALDQKRDQRIRRIEVQQNEDAIILLAEGYKEFGPQAERLARARYLLEDARQQAVLIRSIPAPAVDS